MSNENNPLELTQDDIQEPKGEGFKPLEDSLYEASCAGIIVKEMQNFDKTAMEDKIIFLFQIPTDNGKFRYLLSQPMKKSLHEKATLWKLLSKWTKQPDAKTLIEKMGTGGKFDIKYFIGKPIQLTIGSEAVGDKTYNRIEAFMAPKKGAAGVIDDDSVPTFILDKAKATHLAPGLKIREKKAQEAPVKPEKKVDTEQAPPASEEDGDFPF